MFHFPRKIACAALVVGMAPLAAAAQTAPLSDQDTISRALTAAPPQMRQDSTVVAADGRVLQRGNNGFTCLLGGPPGAQPAPMCLDGVFMGWARQWQSGNRSYQGPEAVGLAYMLAGDSPDGGASNIDPFAARRTAGNQWVVEGPHVMIVAPRQSDLDALPASPDQGGPYVMWRGTPYAHVMMPVGPRDTSRQQASAAPLSSYGPSTAQISEVPSGFQFRDPRSDF